MAKVRKKERQPSERIECEFSLIRYVPDSVRNEFVNIGVLLREARDGGKTIVRFTQDWSRALCLDANADVVILRGLEQEFRLRLGERDPDVKPFMQLVNESFSNIVQVTNAGGCLVPSLEGHVEDLMSMYVEPKEVLAPGCAGRKEIYSRMRKQFRQAKLWGAMRKSIPAAYYTKPGDPLRIDCGFKTKRSENKPNNTMYMYHAVSLEDELYTAKALALCMPALRRGVKQLENASLEFTAVVEPLEQARGGLDEKDWKAHYAFAIETMENQEIRIVTTRDLSALRAMHMHA